ncbi:unnamed protein product [Prorocentrum cordatum]|uniref:Uncharacterized protein n=1 Tax=Prorocentrum cordatum TaxID=2364126 RepID=A0ABN9WML2_9DINO|nr:unnamed protein product [Polarella glacialis]
MGAASEEGAKPFSESSSGFVSFRILTARAVGVGVVVLALLGHARDMHSVGPLQLICLLDDVPEEGRDQIRDPVVEVLAALLELGEVLGGKPAVVSSASVEQRG